MRIFKRKSKMVTVLTVCGIDDCTHTEQRVVPRVSAFTRPYHVSEHRHGLAVHGRTMGPARIV